MSLARDQIDMRPNMRQLFAYWQSLAGGTAPERHLVDPQAIKPLLPWKVATANASRQGCRSMASISGNPAPVI
jgi:hypothetical protein